MVYNVSKAPFDRVVSVDVLSTDALKPKYEPLNANKTYKVIVSSFFVDAGDSFTMIRDHMENHRYVFLNLGEMNLHLWELLSIFIDRVGPKEIDVFIDYAKRERIIATGVGNRITFLT